MAASRAARKREMIANLENEEYLNDLANESYAIIFTQSTTNTVAQKKVKKAFEAGGCHIGAKDKHVSWKAGNGDFQTVDAFLESDNSPIIDVSQAPDTPLTLVGTEFSVMLLTLLTWPFLANRSRFSMQIAPLHAQPESTMSNTFSPSKPLSLIHI